jgi:hypothetical protein
MLCMPSQTTYQRPMVLNRDAFDRQAVALGLCRWNPGVGLVANNSAIAARLGVHPSTVQRIRAGAVVSTALAAAIEREFGLACIRLLGVVAA